MTNERVDLLRLAADDCEAEANNQLREAPNLGPAKEQRNRMDAANIMKRVAALRLWADEMERSVEPKVPHPDCVERVSDLRLEEIKRSFIMALDKGDPNYMVNLEWNEGVSILNELTFKRISENRTVAQDPRNAALTGDQVAAGHSWPGNPPNGYCLKRYSGPNPVTPNCDCTDGVCRHPDERTGAPHADR